MHEVSQGQAPKSPPPSSNTELHQSTEQSTPGESVCESHYVAWESAPNPKSHFSIGEWGATASINAYGQMMLFRNFLEVETYGFISVEQKCESTPDFAHSRAERANQLEWMSGNALPIGETAFGLKFPGLEIGKELPRLSLLRYRWPRYQYHTDKCELDIHWMIHHNHLLQQCIVKNLETSPLDVEFKFCNPDSSMVVRGLNYTATGRGANTCFGQACPDELGWCRSTTLNKSREAILKSRQPSGGYNRPTEASGWPHIGESAAVVVSVFLNGEPMRWKAATSAWTHRLEARTNNDICSSSTTMEVVVAYHLRHSESSYTDLGAISIPAAAVRVGEFLREEPFSPICISGIDLARKDDLQSFPSPDPAIDGVDSLNENILEAFGETASPDKHIEFLTRRHLEHIISVCAIPVHHPPPNPVEIGTPGSKPRRRVISIALTCGDMSEHVIYASSSFFAFMFLLEAFRRLKRICPRDEYVATMLTRISIVCIGHMEWLRLAELDAGLFSLDYWPVGGIRKEYRTFLFGPHIRPFDTSFHIIKAGEFVKVYTEPDYQELARTVVDRVSERWVEGLRLSDKRSVSVWPHCFPKRPKATPEFRLSDQIWIWKALRVVEKMIISPPSDPASQKRGLSELPPSFSPHGLQRNIVKRFTTKNPLIKQRTLAATRSARRVRFTFHAEDTVLLYGEDWGFFHRETKSWNSFINLQNICMDNQIMEWDNVLRYGLALMMGARGYSIISCQHPRELTKSAFSMLVSVSGQNGFFPGKMDFETKEPLQPQTHRDEVLSFNTSFQVPFILFMNALQTSNAYQEPQNTNYELPIIDSPNNMRLNMESPIQPKLERSDSIPNSEAACWLEKYSLLSPLNDPKNIIDIHEEEWLYNYPRVFSSEKVMSQEAFRDTLKNIRNYPFDSSCRTITRGIDEYLSKVTQDPRLAEKEMNSPVAGWDAFDDISETARVIDAAKRRATGKNAIPVMRRPSDSCCFELQATNSALWKHIGGARDALQAKKRFIWLYRADRGTALACYMSAKFDRDVMNRYFERHSQYEKSFLELVDKLPNMWATEFHLSFHRLLRPGESKDAGIPERREETLPGRKKKKIVKCSMGFHFRGDWFDKYWTCYSVEYPQIETGSLRLPLHRFDLKNTGRLWRQRKILEQWLFLIIMEKLLEGSTEIYNEIASEFGFRNDVFTISITDSEDYFSRDWLRLQHMLEAIELDLTESMKIIKKWETRVSDRDEQPRWTEKHERKYGDEVKFWTGVANGQINDLQHLLDKIRALKVVIIQSQEHVRGDLSLRGAENIRFFTYVTVIFLPLSFSASVMSMNGAPSGNLMVGMMIYAIVSLALTFIALYNAAPVGKILRKVFKSYYTSFTNSTMQQSSLVQFPNFMSRSNFDTDTLSTKETDVGSENNLTLHTNPEEGYNAHFWFWFTYIVIELPARRVILGYDILKGGSLSWKAFYHVPTAIAMLPVCLLSFVIRVAFYNLIDLLKFTGGWIVWFFFSPYTENNKESQEHFRWLIQLPEYVRPLQNIHDEMEEMRQTWDRERTGAEEDGKQAGEPDDQAHS
ncbi:unnamed protein product [Clonostachys byssicola]|uniref:Uncharacterized protein n=1 Tax=Clonostachys byssicola TaxID=160290 RepID=A0A9N9UPT4_9HYPO|nr:unnamed protein product [Clonostachys byssicola]